MFRLGHGGRGYRLRRSASPSPSSLRDATSPPLCGGEEPKTWNVGGSTICKAYQNLGSSPRLRGEVRREATTERGSVARRAHSVQQGR